MKTMEGYIYLLILAVHSIELHAQTSNSTTASVTVQPPTTLNGAVQTSTPGVHTSHSIRALSKKQMQGMNTTSDGVTTPVTVTTNSATQNMTSSYTTSMPSTLKHTSIVSKTVSSSKLPASTLSSSPQHSPSNRPKISPTPISSISINTTTAYINSTIERSTRVASVSKYMTITSVQPNANTSPLTSTPTITTIKQTVPTTILPAGRMPTFDKPLQLRQFLVLNGNYNKKLDDHNSLLYTNYSTVMRTFLMKHYSRIQTIKDVEIITFKNGSVVVEYNISISPPSGRHQAEQLFQQIKNATSVWNDKVPVVLIGDVNINRTIRMSAAPIERLQNKLNTPCSGVTDACFLHEQCVIGSNGIYICKHKCSSFDCGGHGTCAVNINGIAICTCNEDSQYVYHGPKCGKRSPKTIPNQTNDTLKIVGGVLIGIITILCFVIIVFVYKRKKNKKNSHDNLSTSNMDIENYKIENIPVDGFGRPGEDISRGRQNLGYQPSNIRKPIQRLSSGSQGMDTSDGEISMDQMPSFDNMDPPEPRTISDYMNDDIQHV